MEGPAGRPADHRRRCPSTSACPWSAAPVHGGILLAVVATVVVVWWLRCDDVGLPAEGGRRQPRGGPPVGPAGRRLLLSAMAVGGALAGIGGCTQLAGAEFKLRPGFVAGYGYIGFLASWLGRHRPARSRSPRRARRHRRRRRQPADRLGLPAASVNVLMALVLLVVFGFGSRSRRRRATRRLAAVRWSEATYECVSLSVEVLTGGVRGGTSILYAALGETRLRAAAA